MSRGHKYESLGGFNLYYDGSRRIVVRDGKPVQTYDPYEALYEWPLSGSRG
jgi:hypothetical protein